MSNERSTDFTFLITLSYITARMAKAELEKRGIPVKVTSAGTNISWEELRGGAASPEIFMPAYPLDIYVPGTRLEECGEIINQFGWRDEKAELPEVHLWQRIMAALVLLPVLFVLATRLFLLLKETFS